MPINLEAVGATSEPVERSWSSADCLLYALGVGAGALDAVNFELEFTTENSTDRAQRVLPTFVTVVGGGGPPRSSLGSFDPAMLVHGEQSIELFERTPISKSGVRRRVVVCNECIEQLVRVFELKLGGERRCVGISTASAHRRTPGCG